MGFGNAMGQMMGMTPPIVHRDPTPEIYSAPMSMAPHVTPTTQNAPLTPVGTNISPVLRDNLPNVRESSAQSTQEQKAAADKQSGMSVGV